MSGSAPQVGEPADLLRAFAGRWEARRVLVDHRAGAVHRFEGILRLTADAFREAGQMRVAGASFAAERAYRLRSAGRGVEVLFPDGRPFVTLDLAAAQVLRHDCGADLYRGRLLFRGPDAFDELWRVGGPAKRYSSLCRYRRLPDG